MTEPVTPMNVGEAQNELVRLRRELDGAYQRRHLTASGDSPELRAIIAQIEDLSDRIQAIPDWRRHLEAGSREDDTLLDPRRRARIADLGLELDLQDLDPPADLRRLREKYRNTCRLLKHSAESLAETHRKAADLAEARAEAMIGGRDPKRLRAEGFDAEATAADLSRVAESLEARVRQAGEELAAEDDRWREVQALTVTHAGFQMLAHAFTLVAVAKRLRQGALILNEEAGQKNRAIPAGRWAPDLSRINESKYATLEDAEAYLSSIEARLAAIGVEA
jgi:hypothetical protein